MLASAGHFLKKEIKAVSKSLVCTPALLLKKFKFQVRNSVHVHSTVLVLCSIMGYSLCRIWCWILWNSPEFEDRPSDHHPLQKFEIWCIRSDLDDLRSLLGSDHLIIGTNPLVSSQQLAECWVYWENAGELKEYLIFTAPECFANISLYAVSSHLLTQITDCERMFSTITRTANRTPQ